jgi:hypothetical protein
MSAMFPVREPQTMAFSFQGTEIVVCITHRAAVGYVE